MRVFPKASKFVPSIQNLINNIQFIITCVIKNIKECALSILYVILISNSFIQNASTAKLIVITG